MTSLTTDELGVTTGTRSVRALERLRRRAEDELAGRTVWCATTIPIADVAVEVFGDGVPETEGLTQGQLAADDVVVLHDPLTAAFIDAIRDSGAHAVWYLGSAQAPLRRAAASALEDLQESMPGVDAFVGTWVEPVGLGIRVERIAALVPSTDAVAAKDVASQYEDVGWSAVLADVVHSDRIETVGGVTRARPTVAIR
jgi:hypothetical protein